MKYLPVTPWLLAFLPLTLTCPVVVTAQMKYPDTRRLDHVDTYHGTEVPDPYRWLEQDVRESEEVAQWVEAQNKVTFGYLDTIPQRRAIQDRLTELWNYERYSAPHQKAGRYFFRKNDGLQNQAVLYVADQLRGDARVLLDPNTWSQDGTVALSSYAVSDNGQLMAYSVSEAGSDWKTIKLLEVDTGKLREDQIRWIRWGSVSWTKDNQGFFYGRYPAPEAGEKFQAVAQDMQVYYHRLGTTQAADKLVFESPDNPDWGYTTNVTHDGQYLVLSISKSTDDQNQVHYRRVDSDGDFTPLIDDFDNQFWFIGSHGDIFYFLTDLDAPTKRLVAMSIDHPGRDRLTEIIPASEDTLEDVTLLADKQFVAGYLRDATTRVRAFDIQGRPIREVSLPGIGTASGFAGQQSDTETFYVFSSFTTPPSIYRYDVPSGESELFRRADTQFDAEAYTVDQFFFKSKDGTRIPMFVTHAKGLKKDGSNPTLLYGYGGFNISITPSFSTTFASWMELGGVVAVANLRGGGEYGEAWHKAGKLKKKQNVFDDFIAAAEYLIEQQYTQTNRLAIMGGSNGGLLVGAVVNQRPDLFGAALPAVGVMDMLRFHLFTAGRFWMDEYGSSDDAEQFKTLIRYSPYHNLRPGTNYPATMVTTADTDDRVVPMHSFKYAAALQRAQAGDAPTLIRIETRAGHGAGTPTAKQIEQVADKWAFLVRELGMELPATDGT